MRITVRTPDLRLPIVVPVPLAFAGALVRLIPEATLDRAREKLPDTVRGFLTKPVLKYLFQEGNDILREYKGLEILSVISSDGESVSIRL